MTQTYIETVIDNQQHIADALAGLIAWAKDNTELRDRIAEHAPAIDIIAHMTETDISMYNSALYVRHGTERGHIFTSDKNNKPLTDAAIRTELQKALDTIHARHATLKAVIERRAELDAANTEILAMRDAVQKPLGPLDNDIFRLLHQEWPALFGLLSTF